MFPTILAGGGGGGGGWSFGVARGIVVHWEGTRHPEERPNCYAIMQGASRRWCDSTSRTCRDVKYNHAPNRLTLTLNPKP